MINLKFGDVIRIHPEVVNPDVVIDKKNISKSKKKPYPVCGIYYKTLDDGTVMLVDCFFWNGNIYEDGVALIPKDKLNDLDYSNPGMISKYFQARKAYRGNLVYERESKYEGMSANEELEDREMKTGLDWLNDDTKGIVGG